MEETMLWTPRAKQRPRAHVVNGRAVTYTPRETMDAERALALQWTHPPLEGPVTLHVTLSDTKVHVDCRPTQPHESRKLRGDIDNYAKLVLDALIGVAYIDDRQLVELYVVKQ